MTVAEALAAARPLGVPRLDAQLLLAHVLARPRAWLLAHDDEMLAPAFVDRYSGELARRAAGVPLAYLVGSKEFHGLALQLTPAVLVPRPETELLVDWALAIGCDGRDVVDLGTGSGAIALAIRAACSTARVTATDASSAALAVAGDNAARLGLAIDFVRGDWWQPLGGQRFALALSNPPYVASGDPHMPALVHEPASALVAGSDGLDALRTIVAGAPQHLLPGGWLLLEHGHDQADAVRELLVARGLVAVETRADLAGLPRCSGGRLPG